MPQNDNGDDGQHREQQPFQKALIHRQLQPRPEMGAEQRQRDGGQAKLPVNIAVSDKAGCGDRGSDAGGELVRAQREVRGEPRQKIGGHGNDPAAPGDGVKKRGHKHADDHDDHHARIQLHRKQHCLHMHHPLPCFARTRPPVYLFSDA